MSKNMKTLLHFVGEREAIRLRRLSGDPAPWTLDPILQKYRFCNIRRRHDRVSLWLLENYYPKFERENIWFAAAIARIINWPPTLKRLMEAGVIPQNPENFKAPEFENVFQQLRDEKQKVYTGAYIVYGGSVAGGTVLDRKESFIARTLLKGLIENRSEIKKAIESNYVQDTVETLASNYGLSTFMAGQIAADLTYLEDQLDEAEDLYTFAPIGPGSKKGLNRLHEKSTYATWSQVEFDLALMEVNDEIKHFHGMTDLTLHDVQNVMCEVSKYFRVLDQAGKLRSNYKPETAF